MSIDEDLLNPAGIDTSVDHLGHDHPVEDEFADVAAKLDRAVDGKVTFDDYSQMLYASDGSIYEARPAGVVFAKHTDDVTAAVEIASEHDIPVVPRGRGTSLAGNPLSEGAIIIDTVKHMDSILEVDPEEKQATCQPGTVLEHLNAETGKHGLKFAPDPASGDRTAVGGCIGNNSTGSHSVRYEITDYYTAELEVVLHDGSVIRTREVVLDSDEWDEIVSKDDQEAEIYRTVRRLVEENQEEIEERYPELKRSVSGYNLNKVIYENEEGERVINLSRLIVGSEGTLGIVTEATLDLVTVPDSTALVLYCFEDLVDAMKAVPQALDFDVSVVELMDDGVIEMALNSTEFAEYAEPIPDGTEASLLLEFDSERKDDFESAIQETNEFFIENGDAFDRIEAYSQEDQDDLWGLRKAAIPLLMSLEGDAKPYPFIEDASVPPEELAEYVQSFQQVLEDHDTSASYFAHAGSGTLHIRPILNLKTREDIDKLHSITEDVTDLALNHDGSFSGEHADGRARTEFNPKMYGPELWDAFKELKTTFDPNWIFNPGITVYRDDPQDYGPQGSDRGVGADNREDLRYGEDYEFEVPFDVELDFSDEGGYSHLVELCNGCATCQVEHKDAMCPTYRVSQEEIQSTRGRANLLRAAMTGELEEDEIYSERFKEEVLDLCMGCKACLRDCPTGVDMAKLKVETEWAVKKEKGASMRDKLFANVEDLLQLGSTFSPLSNWAMDLPGAKTIQEKGLGIAKERDLPAFKSTTLQEWFEKRGGSSVPRSSAERTALFVADPYTNHMYTERGKAAIRVLEAAGVHVEVSSEVTDSGRPAHSKGLLGPARETARENVEVLAPRVKDGWDVVSVEPSASVMFQNDYLDLLDGTSVELVASNAYSVFEYLNEFGLDGNLSVEANGASLTYHGNCMHKGTKKDHHVTEVMDRLGFEVDQLDSTCCGMAGSFGYEKEHYPISKSLMNILESQIHDSPGDEVVVTGASCTMQVGDMPSQSGKPDHAVKRLDASLN
ncbi:MAG: FAD-binding and (Fe-S)-binding domain-containing protein [Halodesulfurarchaeum sp.]